MRTLLLCLSLLCVPVLAGDWYVATNGVDTSGGGGITNPFATVRYAVTRSSAVDGMGQKNIYIRQGDYYDTQVRFENTANERSNMMITGYPGESHTLWGGRPLTNWVTAGSNDWWVADLGVFPDLKTGYASSITASNWQPRMLYIETNGVGMYAPRARETVEGTHYHAQQITNLWMPGTPSSTLFHIIYTNNFDGSTNGEVQVDNSWNDNELAITNVDTTAKVIYLHNYVTWAGQNASGMTCWAMYNTPEGMLQDWNWWWDKTNSSIVLRTPAGIDPNDLFIVVPTTTYIFYSYGYAPTAFASNVVLRGINMKVCNANIGAGGKEDAANYYTSAIALEYSTNCVVDGCTLGFVANKGISRGASGSGWNPTIINNIVHDIGCNGLDWYGTSGGVISNNLIYNCGLLCQAGTGIKPMGGGVVTHNTITNINGSGICGFSHDTNETRVVNNIVVRTVKKLRDMGAIYMDGGTNFTVSLNYVAETYGTNSDAGSPWDFIIVGIYPDYNSRYWRIQSNVVVNCTRPLLYNDHHDALVQNNLFVNYRYGEGTWLMGNSTPVEYVFTNNIILPVRQTLAVYSYPVVNSNTVVNWTGNIVWGQTNTWNPTNATSADPLFTRSALWPNILSQRSSVYGFGSGSPAPGMGIYPIDLTGIGCSFLRPTNNPTVRGKIGLKGGLR